MTDSTNIYVGLDVGSTTAKAVVVDENNKVIWKQYQRHNARQQELVLEYLNAIERDFAGKNVTVFTTGSGGRTVADIIGGVHVQEVNAVTVATEKLHPNAGSVVELGGQDSKIIIWKRDRHGRKSSISYMNDKCAGGTGATLDKIFSKVHLSPEDISKISAKGKSIHHIAAKCGVFAETDVVGLLKAGVAEDEIVVSLCNAIVKQNIEVLLHGNVLSDDVLLLGGPHTYFSAFVDIWRAEVPEIWKLHHWEPKKRPIEELIYVPDDAQYFAAMGAVWFGRESYSMLSSGRQLPIYLGASVLSKSIEESKTTVSKTLGVVLPGLVDSEEEAEAFAAKYAVPPFVAPGFKKGAVVKGYLGIDGGSTSSKLAIVDEDGKLIYKDYVLSKGNPIVDVVAMFKDILAFEKQHGIRFDIQKAGVTGYASSILKTAFSLDSQVVETIAHLKSAKQYYGDVDIICDVGGQDIKVMFMKHGRVVDIKLNTQCSAGNGYFLQSMANQFDVPIEQYAQRAFSVRKAPSFNYGCAVFMEQDKVNFQQLGWTKDEIMCGLALVLPQNIWNYVVQETNLPRLGKRFLLQGGTQKNLAAVKAQVDFIQGRVNDAWVGVHKYADVAGAIGAAVEAKQQTVGTERRFIGIEQAVKVTFISTNNETTRCRFCSNKCTRTFIDISVPGEKKVRHISGYACDKGASESVEEMKAAQQARNETLKDSPNLVAFAEEKVFSPYPAPMHDPVLCSADVLAKRAKMVVGIPRLLNMFYYAPFYYAYFSALGVGEIVYSDVTSKQLWSKGNKWGSIDPCFPAKVAPAHVYNLMQKKEVTHICFPMITHLESVVTNTLGNNACVIQMGTPEVVDAAFTKGRNHFTDSQVDYWKPLVRMDRREEAFGNLYEYFKDILGVTEAENRYAVQCGYSAMDKYLSTLRSKGIEIINRLVDEDKIGILFIGHPYHHDSGLNHGILQDFAASGFPVLCIESLPVSKQFLVPLFGDDSLGMDAEDITDVWQRNFNRNTNVKIWAAKVAARHPNLAVVDMSSFKCGHDAPTYSYIDRILDASETPHFLFHDIDQNKPASTISIRIQSIEYFLEEEQARLKERVKSASKSA
ncbi:MAG: CoA activase [Deltaproteobacteria bacterium]|nr:CoA activase [Deltaproteobacteria bacterium]MBN2672595.1 CoA activase [Deltaproteobacteria bacterium]